MSVELSPVSSPRTIASTAVWEMPPKDAYNVADLDEIDFEAIVTNLDDTAVVSLYFLTAMQNDSPDNWSDAIAFVNLSTVGLQPVIHLPGLDKRLLKFLRIRADGKTEGKKLTFLLRGLGRRKSF